MNKLYCHLCGKEITGVNTIKSDVQDGEFWEACDDMNCESGGTWFSLSYLKNTKELAIMENKNITKEQKLIDDLLNILRDTYECTPEEILDKILCKMYNTDGDTVSNVIENYNL